MIVTTSQTRNVRFQHDEEMPSNGEQSRERDSYRADTETKRRLVAIQ